MKNENSGREGEEIEGFRVKKINRCKEGGSKGGRHGGRTKTVVQVEVKDLMGNQSTKPHHNRQRTSTGKKDRKNHKEGRKTTKHY